MTRPREPGIMATFRARTRDFRKELWDSEDQEQTGQEQAGQAQADRR
ncbi:hypothetical protein [Nesterenkonia sp. PF2B19]|nr:hypothetical protein [Nesterenkonia sp. PF2B19]